MTNSHSSPLRGENVRADFPIFAHAERSGQRLVYLDTAATAQKPQAVIDRLVAFYGEQYGTVRRGAYRLSQEATALYEGVRVQAAAYLNAASASEIVFTRGVTEGINLVARAWGGANLQEGDEVVITEMEHHANILPWQRACRRAGAVLRVAPITDAGEVDLEAFGALLGPRTRLVSFVHLSNALGTLNPAAEMIRMAREVGAVVLLDGAQSAAHEVVDVQALGCDFFVCSSHKMFGPTGCGLLYGRQALLEAMEPDLLGGEMVDRVTYQDATFDQPPHRFEAGTPPFAQVIGLGAALAYIEGLGRPRIAAWEAELLALATQRLREVPGVRVTGTAARKGPILAFVLEGVHPFDLGTLLDEQGIAIRVGQHCAQPLMDRLGVHSTARASFAPYNTVADVDAFIEAIYTARELLA